MKYDELLKENQRLEEEVLRLSQEIVRFKSILTSKNISFGDNLKQVLTLNTTFDSKETKHVSKDSSIEEKLSLYKSLFRAREDVFAYRYERKDGGKGGYSPSCINEWKSGVCDKKNIRCDKCKSRSLKPLSDEDIKLHFNGTKTIGIYPLLKGDICKLFAIDFDKDNWEKDVKSVYDSFEEFDLCPSIEISRSGKGAHLWIFFEEPILACKARYLGDLLMKYTMKHNFGISLSSYDRFFPNQDKMPNGNFGNLIALPLQRIPAKEGYSLFVDDNFNYYPDQWIYLSIIKKNKLSQVIDVIKILESELNEIENISLFKENVAVYNTEGNYKDNALIDYKGKVEIVLSTGIIINTTQLPRELLNEIKKLAVLNNPEFYKRQSLRLYLGKTPRLINGFEQIENKMIMPRGSLEDIISLFDKCKIEYEKIDERFTGENIEIEFIGTLYESQMKAYNEILKQDNGILYASMAFGKTVVALNIIAARKVSTLIIVNSIELLEQWETKIGIFLVSDDMKIGKLGGGRKRKSNFIDIATVQTLNKAENLHEILNSYGQVIIDECHHIAAFTFERVLKQYKAKYVLGLTATVKRKDGLEPIVEFQCGKIRYTNLDKKSNNSNLAYVLIPRKVSLKLDDYEIDKFRMSDYYELIQKDDNRNKLIFKDVMDAIKVGRNSIVLTERLEHLEQLERTLSNCFDRVVLLKGGMGKKQRQEAFNKLSSFKDDENFVLISTGKYIGEGFDDIRLDTLFLTMPISWEGTLMQYAGRLHRKREGKEIVKIYDYIDKNVPQLLRMYRKRQKGYKNMGYDLEENAGIQYKLNY